MRAEVCSKACRKEKKGGEGEGREKGEAFGRLDTEGEAPILTLTNTYAYLLSYWWGKREKGGKRGGGSARWREVI